MDQAALIRLRTKYFGVAAREYEQRRKSEPHWQREQQIVDGMLRRLDTSSIKGVLDIPVGTGRFIPIYKRYGFTLFGQDISDDMLREAQAKCEEEGYADCHLEVGDIFSITLPDSSIDLIVCVRFMQHVDLKAFYAVMDELCRVARHYVVLGIHIVRSHDPAYRRIIRSVLRDPIETVSRVINGLHLNKITSSVAGIDSYMSSTDKCEQAVRNEFLRKGLTVISEEDVLASLRPRKSVSYRLFLLEKRQCVAPA